jgi:hypothetical protein
VAWAEARERELGTISRKRVLAEWTKRWDETSLAGSGWQVSLAKKGQPKAQNTKLYSGLEKAESSVAFQARTGRIGLRHFLAKAKVPGFESPECSCRGGLETAEHVLLYCQDQPSPWPRGARFEGIMGSLESIRKAAKQLIQCGKLGQFSTANKLLYN